MKKAIFCIVAMLFATTGFSQNVSWIQQVGVGNDVEIELQESGEEVVGGAVVDTYFNGSIVDQDGMMNKVYIYQLGQNSSVITQVGNGNYANN